MTARLDELTLSTRVQALKRAEGRNAVCAAAYRSGTMLTCERTGETWDYRNRKGVEYSEMIAPDDAPVWALDRQELWNRAENAERRKDSQVARDVRVMFSYDFTSEQRAALAREIVRDEFVSRGMIADLNIHRYGQSFAEGDEETTEQIAKWRSWGLPFLAEDSSAHTEMQHVMVTYRRDGSIKDYRLYQPHFHVQLTMRPVAADGEGFEKKSAGSVARSWNDQSLWEGVRERIAARQNTLLAEAGSERRLDHRSYGERHEEALELAAQAHSAGQHEEAQHQEMRAQYFTREPQPYLGFAVRLKELTGQIRDRFGQWIAIRHRNRMRAQVQAAFESEEPQTLGTRLLDRLIEYGHQLGVSLFEGDRSPERGWEFEHDR